MTNPKAQFIQKYITKLEDAVYRMSNAEPECFEGEEDNLFDIILEIRNVFAKDLPEISDAILIRHGTGELDANSVIGILTLYLINNYDDKKETQTSDHISAEVDINKQPKLDDTFVSYASDILAETNKGLSGSKIVQYCNSYAIDYNVKIPIVSADFGKFGSKVPNKRTALYKNLQAFNATQQFGIIKDLCNLDFFNDNEDVKKLKTNLYVRYGHLAAEKITNTELVVKTKHWLERHPLALEQYNNSLAKYEGGIFERNTLDDMRLAFELLVKDLLANDKSLENNIAELGIKMKEVNISVEIRNMCTQIIRYYTVFQNNHVKHNDKVNEKEIEYVIEITSVVMKFLIKAIKTEEKQNG